MRSVVDLPAPLGPSSPVMRPSAAARLTSRTAATAPKRLRRLTRLDHGGGPFNEVKKGIGRARRVQPTSSPRAEPRARNCAISRSTHGAVSCP